MTRKEKTKADRDTMIVELPDEMMTKGGIQGHRVVTGNMSAAGHATARSETGTEER